MPRLGKRSHVLVGIKATGDAELIVLRRTVNLVVVVLDAEFHVCQHKPCVRDLLLHLDRNAGQRVGQLSSFRLEVIEAACCPEKALARLGEVTAGRSLVIRVNRAKRLVIKLLGQGISRLPQLVVAVRELAISL